MPIESQEVGRGAGAASVDDQATTNDVAHPRVIVSHAGKQHAYRQAAAVQRAGCLSAFLTSGYYRPRRFPDRFATVFPRLDRLLRRRCLAELDADRVRRHWRFEMPELAARRLKRFGVRDSDCVHWRDAAFDKHVATLVSRRLIVADLFWGYQGSSLKSLHASRSVGMTAVAEFASPHVTTAQRLLRREAEKFPEWADSISGFQFPDWYRERLEQEPHAADMCVAPSRFVMRSLVDAGVPQERIRLLPLGADVGDFAPTERPTGSPFRILFVGKIAQHKGIKYLLDAYRKMRSPSTELLLLGPIIGSGAGLAEYQGLYEWLGSRDHREVAQQMRRCNVLVLPSVLDGCPLVIPEAMMTGMPVIASTHGSAPEYLQEGRSGFIIEPDDVEGLAQRLDLLARDRRRAAEMGRAATEDARRFSWDVHAESVAALLAEFGTLP